MVIIDFMNISKINLNLLIVLHTLLKTRNVTRAGEELFLTQSTVSNSLAQLREIFNDELFIRAPKGLIPTAKALALQPKIAAFVEQFTEIFTPVEFYPASEERTFRLGMSDFCQALILPRLHQLIKQKAPRCKLIIKPVGTLEFLMQEKNNEPNYDLLLGIYKELPQTYCAEVILQDNAVCVANRNHPLIKSKKNLTLSSYLKEKHIAIYYGEDPLQNTVDMLLQAKGYKRQVEMWLPHALTAAHTIIHSKHLITLPKTLAERICQVLPLKYKALPFLNMQGELMQVWHQRFENDAANKWLRKLIKESCEV